MGFDYSKIEVLSIEGIDYSDYPDFCDAYIAEAVYNNKPMTEDELDDLNINHSQFVYDSVIAYIY